MPLYDFKCSNCNEVVELELPPGGRPEKEKHKCGGKLKKVFSLGGIQIK